MVALVNPGFADPNSPFNSDRHQISSIKQQSSNPNLLAASAEEYRDLGRLLANPPSQHDSGLDPERYDKLISEVRQLASRAMDNPRPIHTELINQIVSRGLKEYCDQHGLGDWKLVPMTEELRKNGHNHFTFGQVHDKDGRSIFVGVWTAVQDDKEARIAFSVKVDAEVVDVQRQRYLPAIDARDLYSRDSHPGNIQVPPGSPMANWIENVFGCKSTGFIEGFQPLGVFAEAVSRALDKEGLDHELLPRSRRVPATKPWQIGNFIPFDGAKLEWSDLALNSSGQAMHVTVHLHPRCEIELFKPVSHPENR